MLTFGPSLTPIHPPASIATIPSIVKETGSALERYLVDAIKSNDIEVFKKLVALYAINIEGHKFKTGENFLHCAVAAGSEKIAMYLTGFSRDEVGLPASTVQALVNGKNDAGETPLLYAASFRSRNPVWARALIMRGAIDADGAALLHAAKNGLTGIVRALVRNHLNDYLDAKLGPCAPNVRAYVHGAEYSAALPKALAYAAEAGHLDIVRLLLKVNARDELATGLKAAIRNGHFAVAETLLERHHHTRWDLREALTTAAGDGHAAAVEWLLRAANYTPMDLHAALTIAARRGHADTVKCLHAKGADAALALAVALQPPGTNDEIDGCVISGLKVLGVLGPAVLTYAIKYRSAIDLPMLALLGANLSEATQAAAMHKDASSLHALFRKNVLPLKAITALAESGEVEARDFLLDEWRRYTGQTDQEHALGMRLAAVADSFVKRVLSRSEDEQQFQLGWDKLAKEGYWQTLEILRDASLLNTGALDILVRDQDLRAVRTCIKAGFPITELLHELLAEYTEALDAGLDESGRGLALFTLLKLAGADLSALPKDLNDRILETLSRVESAIAGLSKDDRDEHLHIALLGASVTEVALLLARGADPVVALDMLEPQSRENAIQKLIKAGMVPSAALINCVKQGLMELANGLIEATRPGKSEHHALQGADSLATAALKTLIAEKDLRTAQVFIDVFTDGSQALADFVEANDESSAITLMQLGINPVPVLLNILSRRDFDSAARLIALGADVHMALMSAFSGPEHDSVLGPRNSEVKKALAIAGAEPPIALLRAVEHGDGSAARNLIRKDMATGAEALWRLIWDESLSDDLKHQKLQFLRSAGLDISTVLEMFAGGQRGAFLSQFLKVESPSGAALTTLLNHLA
ncbi:ankyrin repeat domain-containing protein [Bordetella sp. 02P26C-1]|uniref:ankyrin repeat domain-containing protein n=1 Tax=Bordetella sp. 02P26C-1 TaxID=2683195 RepID=UPI00136636CC|nr:ankyrin repeat domain-containing protein [Bordetella sp. 02P26C-1]